MLVLKLALLALPVVKAVTIPYKQVKLHDRAAAYYEDVTPSKSKCPCSITVANAIAESSSETAATSVITVSLIEASPSSTGSTATNIDVRSCDPASSTCSTESVSDSKISATATASRCHHTSTADVSAISGDTSPSRPITRQFSLIIQSSRISATPDPVSTQKITLALRPADNPSTLSSNSVVTTSRGVPSVWGPTPGSEAASSKSSSVATVERSISSRSDPIAREISSNQPDTTVSPSIPTSEIVQRTAPSAIRSSIAGPTTFETFQASIPSAVTSNGPSATAGTAVPVASVQQSDQVGIGSSEPVTNSEPTVPSVTVTGGGSKGTVVASRGFVAAHSYLSVSASSVGATPTNTGVQGTGVITGTPSTVSTLTIASVSPEDQDPVDPLILVDSEGVPMFGIFTLVDPRDSTGPSPTQPATLTAGAVSVGAFSTFEAVIPSGALARSAPTGLTATDKAGSPSAAVVPVSGRYGPDGTAHSSVTWPGSSNSSTWSASITVVPIGSGNVSSGWFIASTGSSGSFADGTVTVGSPPVPALFASSASKASALTLSMLFIITAFTWW